MKMDKGTQFLCKDCEKYSLCEYYHCRKEDSYICKYFHLPIKALEQEPHGDAISRQAVLDVTWEEPSYTDALNVLTEIRDKVKVLPSVTPQQRIGHWIERFDEIGRWYECDQCHTDWGGPVNFCPNCGAKMEE